jgi:hypothetical protein
MNAREHRELLWRRADEKNNAVYDCFIVHVCRLFWGL